MRMLGGKALALVAAVSVAEAVVAAPRVYIPLGETGRVQVVDVALDRVVGTIEGVGNIHGLAATPDGRYLVAGSFAESPPGSESTPPRPAAVSEAEHEKHHAQPTEMSESAAGTSYVSVIDTGSQRVVRLIEVRGAVHHVAISPDGRFAVTTHPGTGRISVIDLAQFGIVATVKTGLVPNYAVFTSDGSKVYVSNAGENAVSEIDAASWSVSRQIPTGRSPEHVVLSPDGQALYVNNVADGTVSLITLTSGRIARTFPVGSVPHGIDVSDDGGTLFATSKAENKLVAIDLASGGMRHITLAPAPYHVTAVHGHGTLYVSSRRLPHATMTPSTSTNAASTTIYDVPTGEP